MTDLLVALNKLADWYRAKALPLWTARAQDPNGAFYEALDFKGQPLTGRARRVRVQSRQVYTFAAAARSGWSKEAGAISERGFGRLIETACPDDAMRGCVHLIDDDGAILDQKRDLYDQAFLLLACAARIAAGDTTNARRIAQNTLDFLDKELASPDGGYFEDDRGALPRRQNPHMHLFEALLALHAATGESAFLDRARRIEFLFNAHFFDRSRGILREFFTADWSLDKKSGDMIEPGHMVEWVVLLDRFEQASGENRSREKQALYRMAISAASPGDAPFLPTASKLKDLGARRARRLWPQTEALRAAVILARAGDRDAANDAAQLIKALFETYFRQEIAGLWCDDYDAAGRPVAADVPASILYHIHEAVACAVDYRERIAG